MLFRFLQNFVFPTALLVGLFSCDQHQANEPQVSLEDYQIEPGFRLEVIAAEPLLESPVAIDFDQQGRIWVVELPGYMADIDGTEEDAPSGKVVILSDTDGNGVMDQRTVFLDSLVAPRALLLTYGGLLYAAPPNLWFVNIDNDQPGAKTLVDSTYVLGGNIEHQPNGLMMNLDNWIYSAGSNNRYQMVDGQWIREQTLYRGQWGLTKDYFGCLFYNNNSNQFEGDYVLPNALLNNPFQEVAAALRQQIVADQRIYPRHAPFINRGYVEGELDSLNRPTKATSACGPVIYQGELFPSDYQSNSFVCIPEGNLIKRNIIDFESIKVTGQQAWQNREFLTATDQAFRPVNLYNGPDGSLFIVDMHRGIIQHRAYMSPYLREKVEETRLDTITGMGRILRVVPETAGRYSAPKIGDQAEALVAALSHPNVWVRDQAQHKLVQEQLKNSAPTLTQQLSDSELNTNTKLHVLWTLKGLDALTFSHLQTCFQQNNIDLKALAIQLLPAVEIDDLSALQRHLNELLGEKNARLDIYLAAAIGRLDLDNVQTFYSTLIQRYPEEAMVIEASISALSAKESLLLEEAKKVNPQADLWVKKVQEIVERRANDQLNRELQPAKSRPYRDMRQVGLDLYRTYCSACHGEDGHGKTNLAPPLYQSEYISGSQEQLALIILHGLKGPIQIAGKEYNFNAAMPGMANNPALSDQDIQSIIHFVRNAYSVEYTDISVEKIQELRQQTPPEGQQYSPETLPDN